MPTLVGHVETGIGDFGRWIAELRDHYKRKTGLILFPDTLNVRLDRPYLLPPDPIRLEAHEYGGSVNVSMVPCRIFDRSAFILRTDVKLRDVFHLEDGDKVTIEVPA